MIEHAIVAVEAPRTTIPPWLLSRHPKVLACEANGDALFSGKHAHGWVLLRRRRRGSGIAIADSVRPVEDVDLEVGTE